MLKFDERVPFQNRKNDILAVGELLVDMITTNYCDDFECNSFQKFFGGSPANIAINAKQLGIRSLVASAVGDDGLGRFLISHLQDAKINSECINIVDYPTSMVFVTKSKSKPSPIFYRGADYHLSYTKKLREAIGNSKIIHFSCWPISKNPSRKVIEKIIQEAKKNDTYICFDPNYHPKIWEKGENGVKYVKSIIEKVDIIKPSEDDAERIFGADSPKNQIDKFIKLGAKLVIMTLGENGAMVSDGKGIMKFDTLATEVVDATGAGDAFWAGFYGGLVKGYTLKEALNLGFAVSAYKLQYLGSVVKLPKLEEIKVMYGV